MNRELSYAIASAKSKVNLSEKNARPAKEGLAVPEDDDMDLRDSPYEVVLDIKTHL